MEERMKKIRSVIAPFLAAWGILSDYQLPGRIIAPFRMMVPANNVLFCLPLTGVLAALIPFLTAWIVSVVFNRTAGAVVFALLGGTLFLFKDSGRGFAFLLSYAGARISGDAPVSALVKGETRLGEVLRNPLMMLAAVIAIIFILAMLTGLFFCGKGFWLTAVLGADAFVQARLGLEIDRQTQMPFIRTSGKGIKYLAAGGIITALMELILFPGIASLGAMVILWVWFWRELPRAEEFREGLSSDWISMYGFWAGILTLLCGMGLLKG